MVSYMVLAIAVIFLLSSALISATGISADPVRPNDGIEFQVNDATSNIGDTIEIRISITSNPGIYGFDIIVSYDLSCIDFKNASLTAGFENNGYIREVNAGTLRLYYENEDLADNDISGDVAIFHFTALKRSVSQVKLSIGPGGACSMEPLGEVDVSFNEGKVSIVGSEGVGDDDRDNSGDPNNDNREGNNGSDFDTDNIEGSKDDNAVLIVAIVAIVGAVLVIFAVISKFR